MYTLGSHNRGKTEMNFFKKLAEYIVTLKPENKSNNLEEIVGSFANGDWHAKFKFQNLANRLLTGQMVVELEGTTFRQDQFAIQDWSGGLHSFLKVHFDRFPSHVKEHGGIQPAHCDNNGCTCEWLSGDEHITGTNDLGSNYTGEWHFGQVSYALLF